MVSRRAGEARKQDIGTAIGETSHVWFTLARGRLDDMFSPRPDTACVRALRLFIDGAPDDEHEHACARPHERVPLLEIETRGAPYTMTKETIADPRSDAVLQRVRWRAPRGRLRIEIEPELAPVEAGTLDHLGHRVIGIDFGRFSVAVAASAPWSSCDGLAGELAAGDVTLAIGFGSDRHIAAHVAYAALLRGFDDIRERYISEWHAWHDQLAKPPEGVLVVRSACVLKTLEAKHVDGGRVAALSKPWGASRPGRAWGSYHLVWTRDSVETVGGMLAAGAGIEARQALTYLAATQRRDGHWPQNMRLDGRAVWKGDELDETALPILLVDLLRREQLLDDRELDGARPMVARAAARLARVGPSTQLDRWEDAHGVTPFTLAAEIAALRVAHTLVDDARLETIADRWDEQVESLLYRRGGPLADRLGIAGYYVRARVPGAPLPSIAKDKLDKTELSPDALALVRFGVRAADDPRVLDTVRAIDAVLKTDAGWRRYPGDTYGEHADGSPWDPDARDRGIGRSWPLLVGERAHYELARGDFDAARALRDQLERLATPTGMLPEQSWDAADLRDRRLVMRGATHSAAPLGWAHAEYMKLCRSLADGTVFDLPSCSTQRVRR